MRVVDIWERTAQLAHREENASLLRNISGTLAIKGAAVAVSVIITPAYLDYLDDRTALGAWFTIVAVLNWMVAFDFGIGNGLRNHLVGTLVRGDRPAARRYISSAYIVMGAGAGALAIIGAALIWNADWNAILNVPRTVMPLSTLQAVVGVVFLGSVLQLWLRLVTSILYAMQKTALSNLLALMSSLGLLAFVLCYKGANSAESLLVLAYAQAIAVNVPLVGATALVFASVLRHHRPSRKYWHRESAQAVANLGGLFFAIQLALLVMNATNELLIGWLYSPSAVVEYQIYFKFFYVIISVFALFTQPVWSAITKADAEGRRGWIGKVYGVFAAMSTGGTLAALVIVGLMPVIVPVWLGDNAIPIRTDYLLVFALLVSVTLFVNSATCIANGLGKLRPQITFTLVGASAKVPVAYLLSRLGIGWISVVAANVLVMAPLLVAQTWQLRSVLAKERPDD